MQDESARVILAFDVAGRLFEVKGSPGDDCALKQWGVWPREPGRDRPGH